MDFKKKLKEVLNSIFELNKGFYGIDPESLSPHDLVKFIDLWAGYDQLLRDTKRDMSNVSIMGKKGE